MFKYALIFAVSNGMTTYINTYYEVMDSTVLSFRSSLYVTNQVYTFELLTDLPSNCSPAPSGNFSISANGDYDISQYASVSVAVPPEVIQGDYHDDLTDIKNVIILVPAVALVIYFLYGIYRFLVGVF